MEHIFRSTCFLDTCKKSSQYSSPTRELENLLHNFKNEGNTFLN